MIYTVVSHIKELPDADYVDGAKTVFLYTRGTKGDCPKELKQFLHYMEKTTAENAQSETLKKIHQMVEKVKNDEEVSIEYMKIFEREKMLIKQGIKQGRMLEVENTEKERRRAEAAEEEVERLKEELRKITQKSGVHT